MPRYKNDAHRVIPAALQLIIPHGGEDGESSSTVTRCEFPEGSSVRFIKTEVRKILSALGLDRTSTRRYIKIAFNNFDDLETIACH